jgi:DNA-directed RNA polymerase subunit RPC12/RpoP
LRPESWIDIFSKKTTTVSSLGHSWTIQKTIGGRKFVVRRSQSASVEETPKTTFYKCEKCGILSVKFGNSDIQLKDSQYDGLTCDECIIKNIIE